MKAILPDLRVPTWNNKLLSITESRTGGSGATTPIINISHLFDEGAFAGLKYLGEIINQEGQWGVYPRNPCPWNFVDTDVSLQVISSSPK